MDDNESGGTAVRRLNRAEARQRTRDRLLNAAAEVFRREGYAGASLEAVAQAAGYTKGAVYSNFATKADLYVALLESTPGWAETGAPKQRLGGQPLEKLIDGLGQIFVKQVTRDRESVVLSVEFWLTAARNAQILKKLVAAAEDQRKRSGQMFDRAVSEAGLESPLTGRELGIVLHALAGGLALAHRLEPEAIDPKLFARASRVLAGLDTANRGQGQRKRTRKATTVRAKRRARA